MNGIHHHYSSPTILGEYVLMIFFQENRGLPSKIQVFTPFVGFLQNDMSFNWPLLMVMSLMS